MKDLLKNNWTSIVVIAMALLWAEAQLPLLPVKMPVHFDVNGHADGFGPRKFALLFVPLVNLFVVFLIGLVGKISPKGFEMPNSQYLIGRFNLGLTVFLMAIYVGMILQAKDPQSGAFAKVMGLGLALFMIFIGNYFGKLERNFFVGIRTPWTIASEENWKQTHRFAGKMFFAGGILSLFFPLLGLPVLAGFYVLIGASVVPAAYSFVYFLKNEKPL